MSPERSARVLVVEDEQLIAMMTEDMLAAIGCTVTVAAYNLASALDSAERADVDFAILDVNLGGEKSFPVADRLRSRGIPFLFLTGYGQSGLEERFRDAPILPKPFSQDALLDAVSAVYPI